MHSADNMNASDKIHLNFLISAGHSHNSLMNFIERVETEFDCFFDSDPAEKRVSSLTFPMLNGLCRKIIHCMAEYYKLRHGSMGSDNIVVVIFPETIGTPTLRLREVLADTQCGNKSSKRSPAPGFKIMTRSQRQAPVNTPESASKSKPVAKRSSQSALTNSKLLNQVALFTKCSTPNSESSAQSGTYDRLNDSFRSNATVGPRVSQDSTLSVPGGDQPNANRADGDERIDASATSHQALQAAPSDTSRETVNASRQSSEFQRMQSAAMANGNGNPAGQAQQNWNYGGQNPAMYAPAYDHHYGPMQGGRGYAGHRDQYGQCYGGQCYSDMHCAPGAPYGPPAYDRNCGYPYHQPPLHPYYRMQYGNQVPLNPTSQGNHPQYHSQMYPGHGQGGHPAVHPSGAENRSTNATGAHPAPPAAQVVEGIADMNISTQGPARVLQPSAHVSQAGVQSPHQSPAGDAGPVSNQTPNNADRSSVPVGHATASPAGAGASGSSHNHGFHVPQSQVPYASIPAGYSSYSQPAGIDHSSQSDYGVCGEVLSSSQPECSPSYSGLDSRSSVHTRSRSDFGTYNRHPLFVACEHTLQTASANGKRASGSFAEFKNFTQGPDSELLNSPKVVKNVLAVLPAADDGCAAESVLELKEYFNQHQGDVRPIGADSEDTKAFVYFKSVDNAQKALNGFRSKVFSVKRFELCPES